MNTFKQLVTKKNEDDALDWNSSKGPQLGTKWKSGQVPSPPVWRYDRDDLRAFHKFSKKVDIWKLQASAYAPAKELALILYTSLSGECEQELEHLPVESFYHAKGIDYLMQQLKGPMESKEVLQKRKFFQDFEAISRFPGEHLRQFAHRCPRLERSLRSVGIGHVRHRLTRRIRGCRWITSG